MVARHGEWYTALRLLIQKLDADGPERAVENMQRAVDLLQSGRNHGAPQGLIDWSLEYIGSEVSLEIQRALATAWRPERVDN